MKKIAIIGPTKRITSTSYSDSGPAVTGGWVDAVVTVVAGDVSVSYMDKYMHV